MNRRGNGLSADTYAPLVDLAPHLADAMLAALGEAGVAAYAASPDGLPEIAGTAADPVGDVLDRLYVDVDMKPAAEGILRAHLARLRDAGVRGDGDGRPETDLAGPKADAPPGRDGVHDGPRDGGLDGSFDDAFDGVFDATAPGRRGDGEPGGGPGASGASGKGDEGGQGRDLDEDAIWAQIVAGFDTAPEGDEVPWPDQENIDERPGPPREGDDRTGRLPRARVIRPADEAPEFPPDDDDEGHYIPPPPPPLPSADPLTKGAWIALIGGPVYLLVTVILDWEVPGWAAFLAVAAFIGGFVTLVLRMGDEPRDPDDGAVV
ncbi:hypothetical protein [Actinomadura montaniterrae]|uniref:DUF308 domain-containing protein n=1 Tax=Actinomadura montaniterrae TaxID=1803903 RepID=A0A6L3VBZ7_9ACTN|nr:hypothetical protein [Actinomadura montaniterrae]KAB2354020.1 hypothetical protein F9B16_49200 [Actinomadura montaniterrae]